MIALIDQGSDLAHLVHTIIDRVSFVRDAYDARDGLYSRSVMRPKSFLLCACVKQTNATWHEKSLVTSHSLETDTQR